MIYNTVGVFHLVDEFQLLTVDFTEVYFCCLDRFYYMNVSGGERYSSHSRDEGSYRYRGDVSKKNNLTLKIS